MTINVTWDNPEQTILFLQFEPNWSWEDIFTVRDQANPMMTSVPHTVHVMVDVEAVRGVPRGLNIARLKEIAADPNANTGLVVLFGVSEVIRPVLNTIVNVTALKNHATFVEDRAQAYTAFEQYTPAAS